MKHLPKAKQKKDVQLHIQIGFELINTFLPATYLDKVKAKLPKDFASNDTIRNVRRGIQKPEAQIEIFTALVEVAKENKAAVERLAEIV
jgi:hypothetical protein